MCIRDSCSLEENTSGLIVSCANLNSPIQTVIAGNSNAVSNVCEKAKEAGAKRAITLNVSVPSHCMLMDKPATLFNESLNKALISEPETKIIQNYSGDFSNNIELITNIGFWKSKITISPVEGGITNQNFLVNDGSGKYFVRIGDDIPEHLVFRSNEIQASNAASKIEVCPELLFHDKSIQVFNFIDGKTLDSTDIKNNLEQITELIKKVHSKMPDQLVGQSVIFWVFYVIKNYKNLTRWYLDIASREAVIKGYDLLKNGSKIPKP